MAGFVQNLLTDVAKGFFGNDYLRDYTHASKTFRTNGYQYAPKLKFLFHVYFDINSSVYPVGLATGANFGLAVKKVKLPSYTFNTTELNQYNRKRIVQTKIKYDPIDITFHDDNGNLIRNLWYYYFTYYFKDANKPVILPAGRQTAAQLEQNVGAANYNSRNLYRDDITGDDDWGYIGEASSSPNSASDANQGISKIPFFKNITIFGFNQHKFVSYVLINPIINKFSHDTYDYSQGNGTMENNMTVDYETVKYFEGGIDGRTPGDIVTGFANQTNYDRTLSPIARPGSNTTILGQGGLVDAAGGFINNLSNGNILGAAQIAGATYNTFKNVNIKQAVKAEVVSEVVNAVQQTPNRNNLFQFPLPGQTGMNRLQAGQQTNALSSPPQINTNNSTGA